MPRFELDKDYTAFYVPLREGNGYVAKGTVLFRGKPVEIFEARGEVLSATTDETHIKAEKICKRLQSAKRGNLAKAKPSRPNKDNKAAMARLDKGPKAD
jgi:hypothetical protein